MKSKIDEIKDDLYKIKDIPLYYFTPFEYIQGMLNGIEDNQIENLYQSIKPCTCGGKPIGIQTECMGDFDFEIHCDNVNCNRFICRSMYDFDVTEEEDEIALAIRDWNKGLIQEDIDKIKEAEHKRVKLRDNDLIWKDIIANNLIGNPKEGIYTILNKKNEDNTYYACKWSIVFQPKEIEPQLIDNSNIELYILFHKRYFYLDMPLSYPNPKEDKGFYEVNDYGDFVRAYKTLEEAKLGALARCGWQGLNKDTILKEK